MVPFSSSTWVFGLGWVLILIITYHCCHRLWSMWWAMLRLTTTMTRSRSLLALVSLSLQPWLVYSIRSLFIYVFLLCSSPAVQATFKRQKFCCCTAAGWFEDFLYHTCWPVSDHGLLHWFAAIPSPLLTQVKVGHCVLSSYYVRRR